MHMPGAFRLVALEEALPVAVRRLVRAGVRGRDLPVDGDADPLERRREELPIGIRERRELESAPSQLRKRAGNLRERLPRGKGVAERALLPRRDQKLFL